MKVNQRERLLLIVVTATVIPLVVVVILFGVLGAFDDRATEIEKLQGEIHGLEIQQAKARKSIRRLKDYRLRSLPADRETARASFQEWLLALLGDHFDADSVLLRAPVERSISAGAGRQRGPQKPVGRQVSYRATAEGTLEDLVRFMHRFYSMPTLHRISKLYLKPTKDSKNLSVELEVAALSLASSAPNKDTVDAIKLTQSVMASLDVCATGSVMPLQPAVIAACSRRGLELPADKSGNKSWRDEWVESPLHRFADPDATFEDFATSILNRNIFGPPNQPPSLARVAQRTTTVNEPFSLSIKASDADDDDQLVILPLGNLPEGAEFRHSDGSNSATLSWTPDKTGEYEFSFRVRDNGWPSKDDSQTITVVVKDPPPPRQEDPPKPPAKPRFDFAKYAVIQAILRGSAGDWMIWVHVKPTDERLVLKVGETFEVGSVKGKVEDIQPQEVILSVNGESRLFRFGDALTAGRELPEI